MMSNLKFISLLFITILLIFVFQFQGVKANQFQPPELMVRQAKESDSSRVEALNGYRVKKMRGGGVEEIRGKVLEEVISPNAEEKRSEGKKEQRSRKAEDWRSGGDKEQRSRGTEEQISEGRSFSPKFENNPVYRQIFTLYQQGEYQQVIEILSNYQEEDLTPFAEYLAACYENTGQISLAVQYWYLAQKSYETNGNYQRAGYCLLKLAQGYLDLGRSREAISLLKNWSYPLPSLSHFVLGNAYFVTGKYEQAIASYQKVLNHQLKTEQKLAALNQLGSSYEKLAIKSENLAKLVKQEEEQKTLSQKANQAEINAKKIREQAWLIGENRSNASAIRAKLNWLEYTTNTREIREIVAQDLEQLPSNHRKIQLLISWAKVSQEPEKPLQKALQLAEEIKDYLGLAIASAELGQIYEQQKQYEIALTYTEEAEKYIYPFLFYEYLYQYQWQEGRIYEGLNQPEQAKSAYRRSLDSLQKIRNQIAFSSKETEFDFQKSIEPIYRSLLTLLLTNNPSSDDLQQSLAIFDQFQLAQLENLFADVCFTGENQDLTSRFQAENIAIITPIILDQSLHIIALTPDGQYYHHAEKISSREINQKIAQWRLDLEDISKEKYLINSTFFYEIIFKPFEEIMAQINPSVIVFINDGLLRNVPMAALFDSNNQQFLIEKYPISVALGQNFFPSVSQPLPNISLAFGLSEALPPVNIPLPNVETELKSVKKIINADTALNQEFTRPNLVAKIKENNLSVLHLATHGEFTGLIENSFIQAYDRILTTPELEEILISADGIDLLTLSACETAAGDNRAVMGLAGVAIRTGIPSVLSTLWSVSDLTTAKMIADFYQHWQSEQNKARALQKVQMEQIRQQSHPRIWSPFVLIGI